MLSALLLATPFASAAASVGSPLSTKSGESLAIDAFDLPPGASVTIELEVTIDNPVTPGTTQVCNQGQASSEDLSGNPRPVVPSDDPATGSPDDPTCTQLLLEADLAVDKMDSVDPVAAGASFSYIVAVNNLSATTATGVTVADTLPAGVGFVTASGTGWSCGFASPTVTCTRPSLPAGGAPPITIDVTAPAEGGSITNAVSVAANEFDPVPGNDSDAEGTTVTPRADLAVTKTDGVTSAVPGGQLTYTIVVSNDGPSTDPAASITDAFPGALACGWTSAAAGGATGNTNNAGPANLADTLSLPPGGSVTYTAACDVAPGATGTLSNTVAVTGSIPDPVSGNDSATDADTTLTPEADLMVGKTDDVDPVVAGDDLTYTVTVDNAGPSDALDVVVTDTLPGGVTLVSTAGCAEDPAGVPTCGLGTIAAGGSKQYTITVSVLSSATGALSNTAAVSSSTTLVNPGDDVDVETTAVATEADLTVDKTDDFDPVVAGDDLTYTVTVDNAGPSDALDVVVTDTLPGGVTLVSTAGCAEDPAGVPTCGLGTIAAGGSKQYTITVSVLSSATGTVSNTAAVSSSTTLVNTGDDMDVETTAVAAEADLMVDKTDDVDPVAAGNNLTYTVTVANAGPSDALDVVVTDTLPGGVTLVSTTGCAEDPAGVPTCGLGTIAAGGSKQYTITVSVLSSAAGTLSNTAAASSSTALVNTGDDIDVETTAVATEADLMVDKTDDVDPVAAGNNLTYTVMVANAGPSDALDLVVTDTLPGGLTLVSTTGCAEDPAGVPTCGLGTVAAGGSKQYTITVSVPSSATGTLSNTAAVSSSTTLVNTGDDMDVETTAVATEADLTVDKTDDFDPVVAGTDLTYTVTVANAGPSDAVGVVATDTLPGGVTLVSTSGCVEAFGVPSCTLGTIAAGGSKQYTITVSVQPDAADPLSNTVSVSSSTTLVNPGDDTDVETTAVVREADLAIEKTAVPPPGVVEAGETVIYTITVTNDGPSSSTGVVVTDVLPAGLILQTTAGDCAEMAAAVPTCTLGTIAPGASKSYTIEVTVDSPAPATVTNTATVAGNEPDPDPGDNSDDVTHSPDAVAPTVLAFDSEPGDGALLSCETVRSAVHRLKVTFSEAMRVSGGVPGPSDADNPDNYLLLGSGPDLDFDTAFCGAPQGDDVAVPIGAAAYAAGTPAPRSTVTLLVSGGLTDGVYRFLACGSASLEDAAGNPLDGDADGAGGDDYVLDRFRVDAGNLFANGHLDCGSAPWLEDPPAAAVHDPAADADGSPLSGSASVPATAGASVTLEQCVSFASVAPGATFELGGRFRLDAPSSAVLGLMAACDFAAGAACGGAPAGSAADVMLVSGAPGVWGSDRTFELALPPGAVSGRCGLSFENPLAFGFSAWLDQLFLRRPAQPVFADGFESGNTSAWSLAVP